MTQDPMPAATSVAERLMPPFDETVRVRRSYRGFLAVPLPDEVIRKVLLDAQYAPSNCNTQPWNLHIVIGAKRDELSKAFHEANDAGRLTPDFSWDEGGFEVATTSAGVSRARSTTATSVWLGMIGKAAVHPLALLESAIRHRHLAISGDGTSGRLRPEVDDDRRRRRGSAAF